MSDIDTNGKLTWTKLKLVSPYTTRSKAHVRILNSDTVCEF